MTPVERNLLCAALVVVVCLLIWWACAGRGGGGKSSLLSKLAKMNVDAYEERPALVAAPNNAVATLQTFLIDGKVKENPDLTVLKAIRIKPGYNSLSQTKKMYQWYRSWERWPLEYRGYAKTLFPISVNNARTSDGSTREIVGAIGPPLVRAVTYVLLFAPIPKPLVKIINGAYVNRENEMVDYGDARYAVPILAQLYEYANTATPAERALISQNMVEALLGGVPGSFRYLKKLAELNPQSTLNWDLQQYLMALASH